MVRVIHSLSSIRHFFSFTPLQYMLDCYEENTSLKQQCYVSSDERSAIVLLGRYLFISSNASREFIKEAIEKIVEQESKEQIGAFTVFYDGDSTVESMKSIFPKVYPGVRMLFIHPKGISKMLDATRVLPIDARLFESALEDLDMITDEVLGTGTYNDMNDFFRRGIGYTYVVNHAIRAFCTSEYPSEKAVAIGIEVHEDFQKQGIAREMTNCFVVKAHLLGYDVYWECWKNNPASVKTAQTCGFTLVGEYPSLFIPLIEK